MLLLTTATVAALLAQTPATTTPGIATCETVAARQRERQPDLRARPLTEEPEAYRILAFVPAFANCPVKTRRLQRAQPQPAQPARADIRP